MRARPVEGLLHVMRAYDRGGGGMLAGALAYYAFFTLVPTLLLFVSLLGVLIEDATLRAELISGVVDQIAPISDLASFVIDGLADSGRTGSIVGLLGLLWGASGFYGALQGAMQRMFPGPGGRDFLRTRLRGAITVVVVLGVLILAIGVIFILPFLTEWIGARCRDLAVLRDLDLGEICGVDLQQISGAIGIVGAMGVAFLMALGVYVAIPIDGPSVREAFVPAIAVGIIIGGFTGLFGWIAPLLVRNWLTLGIVGNVFIALIWLNLTFQALIYGAAFARLRRDHGRVRRGLIEL